MAAMSYEEAKRKHQEEVARQEAAKKEDPFGIPDPPQSHIKHVIAVVSGKGGVGKSLVTGLSAISARRAGYSTAVLDADITGPSIPKMFDLTYADLSADEAGLHPAETTTGIKVMSMNLLMDDPDKPVVWRSPVITGALKQFWSEVVWGDVDYMFVDMPPGTGDIPLTVYQSLPIDGILLVATPQDLVAMIVEKAVSMAKLMNKPILGIVENMSYVVCPHCGEEIPVFGESHVKEIAERGGFPVVGRIPIDPSFAQLCDAGQLEYVEVPFMQDLLKALPKDE